MVCRDRGCAGTTSLLACAPTGSCPLSPIASAGVYFWRARAIDAAGAAGPWSATWELVSIEPGAPVSSTVGLVLDLDEDGLSDVVFGGLNGAEIEVRYGAALTTPQALALVATSRLAADAAGDLNGDGAGDLVAGTVTTSHLVSRWSWQVILGRTDGSWSVTRLELPHDNTNVAYLEPTGAGDIDGDGFGDVVAGVPNATNDGGCFYVYPGSPTGPLAAPTQQFCYEGDPAMARWFGGNIASGADVNGDGYADVVVASGSEQLLLHQYLGSAGGLSDGTEIAVVTDWTPVTTASGFSSPTGIAFIGDVDGDGRTDLGVPVVHATESGLLVFRGGASGIGAAYDARVTWSIGGSYGLSGLGDTNGDGFDDIAIGSSQEGPPVGAPAGVVEVILGGPSGLAPVPSIVIVGPDGASGAFGNDIGGPGDVDGDGRTDLVVGAPRGAPERRGRVYLFVGPITDTPTMSWTGWAANMGWGGWAGTGR